MLNEKELVLVSGASGDTVHVAKVAAASGAGTYAGAATLGTVAVAAAMGEGLSATTLAVGALCVVAAPEVLVVAGVGAAVGALLAWSPWD